MSSGETPSGPGLGSSQPSPQSHSASSPAHFPVSSNSNNQQHQQVSSFTTSIQLPSSMIHPQSPHLPMGPPVQQHAPPSQFLQQQSYQQQSQSGSPSIGFQQHQQIRHPHSGITQQHYMGGGGGPLHQPSQQQSYPSQPGALMSQSIQQQQPGAPSYPTDSINALQKAISSMEDRGLQDDPRYSTLLAVRAKHDVMTPASPGPPLDSNRLVFLCLTFKPLSKTKLDFFLGKTRLLHMDLRIKLR